MLEHSFIESIKSLKTCTFNPEKNPLYDSMEVANDVDKHGTFSRWVNQHGDDLYSWAFHKTSDEAIAQDLVQETFLSAYVNLENFKGSAAPKTWLFSILKNKIIDYYRKQAKNISTPLNTQDETLIFFDENGRWKKEKRPALWEAADESLLDNPEFESALTNCMGKLPPFWASCMQLKYLSKKDSTDICQQLNITASNLWQIIHRAKLHLRSCLENNWFKS